MPIPKLEYELLPGEKRTEVLFELLKSALWVSSELTPTSNLVVLYGAVTKRLPEAEMLEGEIELSAAPFVRLVKLEVTTNKGTVNGKVILEVKDEGQQVPTFMELTVEGKRFCYRLEPAS
jgi:hypothetical protein